VILEWVLACFVVMLVLNLNSMLWIVDWMEAWQCYLK
jgi:hypothetical protein